jgi:hypothetical protein
MGARPRGLNLQTRNQEGRAQGLPPRKRTDGVDNDFFDLDLAGVGRRIWGYLIDLALLAAISYTDFRVVTHWFGRSRSAVLAVLVLQILVVLSYGAVLMAWRGATVGMTAAKLVAVDRITCRHLNWRRSWARAAIAFALIGIATDVVYVSGLKASQPGVGGAIAGAASLATIAGYGTFYYWARYDALHQTLQDKVGHSIVLHTGTHRKKSTKRRPKWSWRVAASGLGRQYVSGHTTPVGRRARRVRP